MANEHRNCPIGYKYTCGVPASACGGHRFTTSAALSATSQSHGHASPEEAFRCRVRYLVSLGYTRVGGQALQAPAHLGGEVLVLTRPSRFGGRLRGGKGTRYMPNAPRTTGHRGGNVAAY